MFWSARHYRHYRHKQKAAMTVMTTMTFKTKHLPRNIMIQLEKYRGTKSRHTCPACNSKNCFVRYIGENGEYLRGDVGRCNRESKCGYHYKPKQFFADNPTVTVGRDKWSGKPKKRGALNYGFAARTAVRDVSDANLSDTFDFIPFERFKPTLANYERNGFVRFLLDLFPNCADEIRNVLKMYLVGTYEDYTCFPSIDRLNRICRAKLIRFNRTTGRRLKGDYDTSSLPAKLKLKAGYNYKQIFFGEHLLTKFPNKPVAVVEAEKTAIIASLCFPGFIWLGCNSKTWLKAERLERLGQRQITLYPDADGFNLWQRIAQDAARRGLTVKVSNLIENNATIEQKSSGYDLADYLISQQIEINENNDFIDRYNEKLAQVLSDDSLLNRFNVILNERIAICEFDGELPPAEAVAVATTPENLRRIIVDL